MHGCKVWILCQKFRYFFANCLKENTFGFKHITIGGNGGFDDYARAQ